MWNPQKLYYYFMHSLNVLEDSGCSLILFLRASSLLPVLECFQSYYRACDLPPRGGGTPPMKWVAMLVVSLRGVNFGFWSHLGYSGQNAIILAVKVSFRVAREKI